MRRLKIGALKVSTQMAPLVSTICSSLGKRLGSVFGKRMEVAGGLVLIGIGVKILLDHVVAR
jgi:putative Mn2+ efflux pump MntP